MSRRWIKLHVEPILRGSLIAELTPEQRWIFVGILLLGGDSPIPGTVYQRKDEHGQIVGYPHEIIADIIGVSTESFSISLLKMIDKKKVSVDERGVISICNWSKYQSDYDRTRNAPSRVVQKYTIDREVDIDRDIEIDKEKNRAICFNYKTKLWDGIQKEDMEEWAKRYPPLDINGQLAEMRDWLLDNPTRAKKRYRTFITRWMKRSLADGGNGQGRRNSQGVDMRVGESRGQDKDEDYWRRVRELKAQGLAGAELTAALAKEKQ